MAMVHTICFIHEVCGEIAASEPVAAQQKVAGTLIGYYALSVVA